MSSSRKDTGNKKTKVGSLGISNNQRDERMVRKAKEKRGKAGVWESRQRNGETLVSTEKLLLIRVKALPLGLVTRGSLVGFFSLISLHSWELSCVTLNKQFNNNRYFTDLL